MLTIGDGYKMEILNRLLARKKPEKTTVWGVRVPEKVKRRWLLLSAIMRVPCNRLILFVLQDWIRQNAEILTDDKARNQLADRISQQYLNGKSN